MLYNINNFISNSGWKYLFYGIDIILVTILFYILYIFVYNTRAYNVVAGFIILFFITLIARVFGLTTLSWIFDKFFQVGLIAIVVLFQAEIRHGLR
ncbi:MAG: TIGR00159 family protein, partial [Brachyspira sp.]|nr:TIGR00159 family protein [Brachyspira sp.]